MYFIDTSRGSMPAVAVGSVRVHRCVVCSISCNGEEYGLVYRVGLCDTKLPTDFDLVYNSWPMCIEWSLIDMWCISCNSNASSSGLLGLGKICHHAKFNSSGVDTNRVAMDFKGESK